MQQQMFAGDVVAMEYRRLGFWRRLVLRWVSKDLHAAARHLSQHQQPMVNVPVYQAKGPFDGLVSKPVERVFAEARR